MLTDDTRSIAVEILNHIPGPTDGRLSVDEVARDHNVDERAVKFLMLLPALFDALDMELVDDQLVSVRARSDAALAWIRSVAAYLQAGETVTSNWERHGTLPSSLAMATALRSGPQFLRLMDESRLSRGEEPTRNLTVVKAIITIDTKDGRRYLAHRERGNMLQLIGGRVRRADTSVEWALRREMEEELTLVHRAPEAQIHIKPIGPAPIVFDGVSPKMGALTRHKIHYFAVSFSSIDMELNPSLHWLAESELATGSSDNQDPINEPAFASLLASCATELRALPPSLSADRVLSGNKTVDPIATRLVRFAKKNWLGILGVVLAVVGVVVTILIA